MSVIVAIKENGVVYMGADAQTTTGSFKSVSTGAASVKISKLKGGILAGFCGKVASKQEILATDGIFTLDSEGRLTKEHIVRHVIPKLLDKLDVFGDEETGELAVSILLAHKDSLFHITSDRCVFNVTDHMSTGAGAPFTRYALYSTEGQAPRDRILLALGESAKRCESVCAPFVLIDTENLEYEIVGGNQP